MSLLHAFFSNLPHEWLESTHTLIKHLRPVSSVAMVRIAFRIMSPLLPRLAFARPLFMKVRWEIFFMHVNMELLILSTDKKIACKRSSHLTVDAYRN